MRNALAYASMLRVQCTVGWSRPRPKPCAGQSVLGLNTIYMHGLLLFLWAFDPRPRAVVPPWCTVLGPNLLAIIDMSGLAGTNHACCAGPGSNEN